MEDAPALRAERQRTDEPLSWENLGAQPAGGAFRESMKELLARPRSFFGKMAVSGGLHEPLTFFSMVLAAGVVAAFLAALSHVGLPLAQQAQATFGLGGVPGLAARASGLLLVLLPLVLVGGSAVMVLLGTLFHVAAKLFGARSWEGSVSVWLYAVSGALVPVVASLSAVFAVALLGYLLGTAWPGAGETAAGFARWTALILLSAGILAGMILIVVGTIVGCTRSFELDATLGAAAGVSGLLLVGAAVGVPVAGFARWGVGGWLIATAACICVATALAAVNVVRSQEDGRSG